MFFFIQSIASTSTDRQFVTVAGQNTLSGSLIKKGAVVMADVTKRNHYPVGTVFYTETLLSMRGKFAASDIFPLNVNDGLLPADQDEIKSIRYIEAKGAYERLLKETGNKTPDAPPSPEPSSARPVRKDSTLLARIRKEYPCPTVAECGFHVDPATWAVMVRNVLKTHPMIISGPSGTGKTEIVRLIADRLGMPLHSYDMGAMHDPMSQLLGTHRLASDGTTTRSVFEYARFVDEVQQRGIILLDELSRAPLMTNNILFPCLDGRRELRIDAAGEGDVRQVKVHPECVFIATANIGSEYTGTTTLDKALVSRLFPVEMDYLAPQFEVDVLKSRTGIPDDDAEHLVSIAGEIRRLYREGSLSASIATRETIMAAEMVADGWDVKTAVDLTFIPMFETEERDQVKRLIMKY